MDEGVISTEISGGSVTGVVGAGTVVIGNFYAAPPPSKTWTAGPIPPCPYPGLSYFGPGDRSIFFGRETTIARLAGTVPNQGLTALVGASGSGKSSVVLAGLAPALAERGGWIFSYFRVGIETDKNPFAALARALVPLLGTTQDAVEGLREVANLTVALSAEDISLSNILSQCRARNPGKRILLIADQFEEVFTLIPEEAIRNRFVDLLLSGFASSQAGQPDVCLVLTLRADFYGMAMRHRPLSDALQGHVENLGPMTREELCDAIVKPAGDVTYEKGLVETLLDDVARRPGNLPLLQFALREMWFLQEQGCITHAAYDAIGRVEGALAKRAQAIFETLTNRERDQSSVALFRRLFTRLVTLGEGIEDTRRVVDRTEIGEDAWALAQGLADEGNRLVVTSASDPEHEVVEIAHEALIRNWPTLIEWINRDRSFQSWLRQLKPLVEQWTANPEDEGTLLRGGPLLIAQDWLKRRGPDLSRKEQAFIAASLDAREAAKRREEDARRTELKQQQELANEQRQRAAVAERLAEEEMARAREAKRRTRAVAVGAAAAVLLALVASGVGAYAWLLYHEANIQRHLAIFQQDNAEKQKAIAEAQTTEAVRQKQIAEEQASIAVSRERELQYRLLAEDLRAARFANALDQTAMLISDGESDLALTGHQLAASLMPLDKAMSSLPRGQPFNWQNQSYFLSSDGDVVGLLGPPYTHFLTRERATIAWDEDGRGIALTSSGDTLASLSTDRSALFCGSSVTANNTLIMYFVGYAGVTLGGRFVDMWEWDPRSSSLRDVTEVAEIPQEIEWANDDCTQINAESNVSVSPIPELRFPALRDESQLWKRDVEADSTVLFSRIEAEIKRFSEHPDEGDPSEYSVDGFFSPTVGEEHTKFGGIYPHPIFVQAGGYNVLFGINTFGMGGELFTFCRSTQRAHECDYVDVTYGQNEVNGIRANSASDRIAVFGRDFHITDLDVEGQEDVEIVAQTDLLLLEILQDLSVKTLYRNDALGGVIDVSMIVGRGVVAVLTEGRVLVLQDKGDGYVERFSISVPKDTAAISWIGKDQLLAVSRSGVVEALSTTDDAAELSWTPFVLQGGSIKPDEDELEDPVLIAARPDLRIAAVVHNGQITLIDTRIGAPVSRPFLIEMDFPAEAGASSLSNGRDVVVDFAGVKMTRLGADYDDSFSRTAISGGSGSKSLAEDSGSSLRAATP